MTKAELVAAMADLPDDADVFFLVPESIPGTLDDKPIRMSTEPGQLITFDTVVNYDEDGAYIRACGRAAYDASVTPDNPPLKAFAVLECRG